MSFSIEKNVWGGCIGPDAIPSRFFKDTLVNVYVDLVVFTRIAGTHRPEVIDINWC